MPYWVSPTGTATWAAASSATPLSGTACCSIPTMLTNIAAGNTAYLRGGTYAHGILLQSRSGTALNPIVIEAHTGETPDLQNVTNSIFAGRYHGLQLRECAYIRIKGITFTHVLSAQNYLMQLEQGTNRIHLEDCVFDGSNTAATVNIWKGNASSPDSSAATHCYFKRCEWKRFGSVGGTPANDYGGLQVGMFASPYDQASGNHTFEDCTFSGGGHHNIETFSKYNVIRGCYFYNPGSMPNTGGAATYGPDANGLYGNRNIQIYDGTSQSGMFNLLEGNRFGHSGPPPDDDGGDGMTITAPRNLIRFNYVYNSQNNGVYFKSGSGSLSDNNRFYHNTIFKSGRYQNTGPQWQGSSFRVAGIYMESAITSIVGVAGTVTVVAASPTRMVAGSVATVAGTTNYNGNHTLLTVSEDRLTLTFATSGTFAQENTGTVRGTGPQVGNVVVNNLLHEHGGSVDWALQSQIEANNTIANNFATSDGDPLFTDETIGDWDDPTLPNLATQAGSPVRAAAAPLTTTTNAGTSSTTLAVADPYSFQDGTWGSDLAPLSPDTIAVGTTGNYAQIASIDYATGTITLATPLTWSSNASVWLYADSRGERRLYGAPDIGAYQSDLALTEDAGRPYAPTNLQLVP